MNRAGLALAAWLLTATLAAAGPAPPPAASARADLVAAGDAVRFAAWVTATNDSHDRPFIVIDKVGARAFLYTAAGGFAGDAPVLLGLAKGDRSAPGIGARALSAIRAHERTTPAGRFDAALGRDLAGVDILWVDYDAAISMHRVIKGSPKDRRLERLATPDPRDNRISYGCINAPVAFYEGLVKPAFSAQGGVVYILPDTESLATIFPTYVRAEHRGPRP